MADQNERVQALLKECIHGTSETDGSQTALRKGRPQLSLQAVHAAVQIKSNTGHRAQGTLDKVHATYPPVCNIPSNMHMLTRCTKIFFVRLAEPSAVLLPDFKVLRK